MVTRKFYLKLLMSLLLVALAVPQGKAETLDVADGTETNNCVPVHGYYYDTQGITSQMIYPESLIEDMQGSTITGIKFYCSNANGIVFSGGKLTFTIGTTTQSTFSSASAITITGTVSTAEYVPASGDTEINLVFDTPFEYNEGNIIIQSYATTKGSCDSYNNYTYFYGITQNSASYCSTANYGRAEVVNFLPKTTFTYESTGPKPKITATPASLNFSTEVGTAVPYNVTISGINLTGNISAEIVDDANNAYSIDVNSITATSGNAQGTITVTYNPSAAGDHTAILRLTSDGATTVDVPLTGTATAPAVDYAVSMSDNSGEHDFGAVLVNNTKVWTLTITNNGLQSVTPTLSGIEAPFSTNYTAAALAAGQSVDIEIIFAPTELTNYSNTVTISFPEAGDAIDAYTCELSGRGVDESYDPEAEKEVVKLITVDKRSIYEPNFIDEANGNTTPQQLNCYDMRFKMAQPDDPTKQIKAGDLRPGNNLFEFYAIDDFGTEFRFATINLFAEGNAADAPAMYILGEAEGNTWDPNIGVKMDTQDGETFTKQVTFNGKNNENGQLVDYFSFSSKLANTWDAIAQYRLTPVADGNFWITDTYLSNPQNISLVQGTEKSIRIPAGTYNITVNATNKTCLVEKVNDATVASAPRNASKPSNTALDVPIKVTPSVEYYTEDGMPVHPNHTHNTTLNYQKKFYYNINDLVDLEGVIDYVNDTWSANTATNSHPDHYKFQIRGVGKFGEMITSLTSEYVESHMTGYGNSLVLPEGWERGSWVGPNNEIDNVHSYYYYDLYIKRSFFDERGITGPVTVVVNTTLSGSGFNADNYKAMSVNGVEQIIAKEAFKDYSWTVPLGNDLPENTVVEQVPMGVVIRLVSTGADFNRTTGIYIYGGGTGVSNVDTVNIYKSSMNVKAYTQKQVDEDTDRGLVAMKNGDTETSRADVNVLAYADPAVTSYKLYENSSASTTDMSHVATATHNENGSYTVNSVSDYNYTYEYVRDETLGNIDGMWLPMYPAESQKYFLPVTYANGVGDDGVVRSENNTYGSGMQQVEKNGSVNFNSSNCVRSNYTWLKDGVTYSYFSPTVVLEGELPATTGYQLYKYRLWVDYDEDAPAWDFEIDADGKTHLTTKMDRPLGEIQTQNAAPVTIGGALPEGSIKKDWIFVAPADLDKVKLVARFYYKKNSSSKARPTDSDRLYYVVEKQIEVPVNQIITGIDNVSSKAVANVKYYNMAGIESDVPFQGINIEVTTYTDGSRTTRKIMK